MAVQPRQAAPGRPCRGMVVAVPNTAYRKSLPRRSYGTWDWCRTYEMDIQPGGPWELSG